MTRMDRPSQDSLKIKTLTMSCATLSKSNHLLDIDGDICHHAHNTVKKFLSPFDKYIEHLTDDIYTDMKYSLDLREYLSEICAYIDVRYCMPVDRVDHRWLSSFDAAGTTLFLFKALVLFYFAWVPQDMKLVYQQDIDELLSQCSMAVKKANDNHTSGVP